MSVAERIRVLMGDLSAPAFAAYIGEEKPQRLKDVLAERQRVPEDMLVRIVKCTGCDANWLLLGGARPEQRPLAPDEATLLDNYRHAPAGVQAGVKTTLGAFAPGAGGPKRGKAA